MKINLFNLGIKLNLIITLLFVLNYINCNSTEERQRKAIEQVLTDDLKFMEFTQAEIKNKKNSIESYKSYTQNLRNIDLKNCPEDFALAFTKHIHAWEQAVIEMEKKDNDFLGRLITGAIGLFIGNPALATSALFSQLNAKGVDMSQVIKSWQDVELLATKYKVEIPKPKSSKTN